MLVEGRYSKIQKRLHQFKNCTNLHAASLAPPLLTCQVGRHAHEQKLKHSKTWVMTNANVCSTKMPAFQPLNTLVDLQLHLRVHYSDDASQRGHETSQSNDARIALIDP